jgi:hypothetical protein
MWKTPDVLHQEFSTVFVHCTAESAAAIANKELPPMHNARATASTSAWQATGVQAFMAIKRQ